MTTASEVCEYECLKTSFVFGIVDILGLAAPEWFLFFAFKIFYCTRTHTLKSLFIFKWEGQARHFIGGPVKIYMSSKILQVVKRISVSSITQDLRDLKSQ
jgi:hypothetical protein